MLVEKSFCPDPEIQEVKEKSYVFLHYVLVHFLEKTLCDGVLVFNIDNFEVHLYK